MKRLHLIEIHDQGWCPRAIRDAETDYLQFVIATTKPYAAMVPILAAALQRTGTRQVLDLCSGAGGPWLWLHPVLSERGVEVSVWPVRFTGAKASPLLRAHSTAPWRCCSCCWCR